MALAYKTVLDNITLTRDGSLNIRLGLLVVDGTDERSCNWHRFGVSPGEDPLVQLQEVIENIATMGYPALSEAEIWTIIAVANVRNGPGDE